MNFSRRLLQNYLRNLPIKSPKNHCSTLAREISVQTYCDIYVNVPYNVQVKPLDVHKYHNADKLKIDLIGVNSNRRTIKHIQNGNNVKILGGNHGYDANVTCNIEAPIKANLQIKSPGNISTGSFSGSKLILSSTNGNIYVEKYTGESIDLLTEKGNIVLKGAVVAGNIKAQVLYAGSIKTKRLQGLNAHLKTHQGNITVDASYCDNCIFQTKFGHLDLQNIHKKNRIYIQKGNLNLNGLDGQLEAELCNTNADIQISRILDDSKIVMKQSGDLTLRLSQECQEDTMFEIISRKHSLDPSIKLIPSKNEDTLYLTPTSDNYKYVYVSCENAPVNIQSTSWVNMLKLNLDK